jgi:hypothetical protein
MRWCLAALLLLCAVNSRAVADIVTGAGPGGGPHVKAFSDSGTEIQSFFAYSASFAGGVRVAAGDVNGDGFADIITGAGPGGGPHVKVFDGQSGSELSSFFAYSSGVASVFVGAGDIDNDGFDDIITGTDTGASPHVKVFSGQTGGELRSFFAYSAAFDGGVRVAGGDVNNDDFDDIITVSSAGATPHVKVFDGITGAELRSFLADGTGNSGAFVGSGDVDGDGYDDIITAADAGAAPLVKVYSGQTGLELRSFLAYSATFDGGVRVAAADINRDGFADIITGAGPGAGPHVKVFDGQTGGELLSFLAYGTFAGGVYVAGSTVVPEPTTALLGVGLASAMVGVGRPRRIERR